MDWPVPESTRPDQQRFSDRAESPFANSPLERKALAIQGKICTAWIAVLSVPLPLRIWCLENKPPSACRAWKPRPPALTGKGSKFFL
ncbi:hypothetical protein SUGI_0369020 [Cryptomeria japonica]|nr:hypothetical protein SUGI_0369020 [Cryptomeria japonica]